MAVIKVGAATEVELKEKKHRFEDALSSARSGIEEGVVPGGGVALLRAAKVLDKLDGDEEDGDVKAGIKIVQRCLQEPLRRIAENAGYEGAVVADKVLSNRSYNHGFDALREEYGDLVKAGITDPVKVVRAALENAGSATVKVNFAPIARIR